MKILQKEEVNNFFMINLKPVQLSDKSWVDTLCNLENSRSADYNFANIYMWDQAYQQKLGQFGSRLIITPGYCRCPFFAFPIGCGDLKATIEEMSESMKQCGLTLRLRGVLKEHREQLEELFPGKFIFTENRSIFDYIYSAEKLATLAGKKLHSKRNHINRFMESNDWRFERLTPDLIPKCRDMMEHWTEKNPSALETSLVLEYDALSRALLNFEFLGLEGGVLWNGDTIIGFTMGEQISNDTFNIHFEKAYGEIQGAYPMINREFARQIVEDHPHIQYINREDDMGRENLRKAKLSYYPEFLVEKYTAYWIA